MMGIAPLNPSYAPPIDKVFAFDDIGKAFDRMEANQHLGKIGVTL
jgi:NADPH2:quinone reductase